VGINSDRDQGRGIPAAYRQENPMSKFAGLGLAVEKPGRMPIIHPVTRQPLVDKDGAPAYIDLYSSDSEIARKHNQAVSRRRLSTAGRGSRIRITPEELEADQIELLVALTVGWRLLTLDGAPLDIPFSPAEARDLYGSQEAAWLREQIDEFAGDRANFSKASSNS
jgi:hypothetical protein